MPRLRKFRRSAEAAVDGTIPLLESEPGLLEHPAVQGQPRLRLRRDEAGQLLMNVPGRSQQVLPPIRPQALDLLEHRQEARLAVAGGRRKIGPAVKRFQVRGEKTVERPAPLPARGLNKSHVDVIHIGPFLAVHFDADEMFVEITGHPFVLKGLAFHDVAPMAGGVADAEEKRFVLGAGFLERFFAPRIPIHRVVLVLKQVGRFLAGQPVGVNGR